MDKYCPSIRTLYAVLVSLITLSLSSSPALAQSGSGTAKIASTKTTVKPKHQVVTTPLNAASSATANQSVARNFSASARPIRNI